MELTKNNLIETYIKRFKENSKEYGRDYQEICEYLIGSSFFDEPASVRFHGNHPGGLAVHCIRFTNTLKSLLNENTNADFLSEDTLKIDEMFDPFIIAVCHDFNKVGLYKITDKSKKIDGEWRQFLAYSYNDRGDSYTNAEISLQLALKFVPSLTEVERLAIRWVEGRYEDSCETIAGRVRLDNALKYDIRVYLSHTADMISSKYLEKGHDEETVDKLIRKWRLYNI